MAQFPFWLALPAGGLSSLQAERYGEAQAWTFSSAEKMAAFLGAHRAVQWETKLIDRYSAPAVISKLQTDGFLTICHDSDASGEGGLSLRLTNFLAALSG